MLQKYNSKKSIISIIISIFVLLFLNSCSLFNSDKKQKTEEEIKVNEKPYEPNVLKRVDSRYKDNSVSIWGNKKTNAQAAQDNILWQATLKALDDIPISEANYAGGIIITDWYSKDFSNESIRIRIVFLSQDLKITSLEIKSHKKTCKNNACQTVTLNENFNSAIKDKIFNNARSLALEKSKDKK